MSALIILLILGTWIVLLYNAGFYASFAIHRKPLRQMIGATTVVCLFALPIMDEIIGAKEFDAVCKSATGFQFAETPEGKKFDLRASSTVGVLLHGYKRPIREYTQTFSDADTGQPIATGKGYSAQGGWLVRALGRNPINGSQDALLGKTNCDPFIQSAEGHRKLNSLTSANK